MSKLIKLKPLGEILKDAGLITAPQIKVALHDQIYYQDMRFGEILTLRGWIEPHTADFFVEEWWELIKKEKKYPLGFYLKRAGLLTEEQIKLVLQEQDNTLLRFGTTAVLKGLLKQETVDFFLENLFPDQISKRTLVAPTIIEEKPRNRKNQITKEDITHWVVLSSQKLTSF